MQQLKLNILHFFADGVPQLLCCNVPRLWNLTSYMDEHVWSYHRHLTKRKRWKEPSVSLYKGRLLAPATQKKPWGSQTVILFLGFTLNRAIYYPDIAIQAAYFSPFCAKSYRSDHLWIQFELKPFLSLPLQCCILTNAFMASTKIHLHPHQHTMLP